MDLNEILKEIDIKSVLKDNTKTTKQWIDQFYERVNKEKVVKHSYMGVRSKMAAIAKDTEENRSIMAWLWDKCDRYERTNKGSFSKCFWGNLK